MSLASCKLAIKQTGLDDPLIDAAIRNLEAHEYDNAPLMASLKHLVEMLDGKYFVSQEIHFKTGGDDGVYRALFAKARAANAVLFALNPDPFVAATHSIYESCAAVGTAQTETAVCEVLQAR